MPSTSDQHGYLPQADWKAEGLRYHRLSWHLKKRFGQPVAKATVDAGLGCPNRDGTLAHGGCVFCDPASFSPARRLGLGSITQQIDESVRRLASRKPPHKLIAYFQPGSNTYGPVERLRAAYEEAVEHPAVVGLAIGTRPDCLPDEVLDLLVEMRQRTWLMLELGVQSLHDRSLAWIGRGHDSRTSLEAIERAKRRGLNVGVHLILGLPGETTAEIVATTRRLAQLQINAVKLHNLYAVRNTALADLVEQDAVGLPSLVEYISMAVAVLEHLPPGVVIDRLSGDAGPNFLVAPPWAGQKAAVRQAIEAELATRDTWQGRLAPE